jgi:hypothetical protein
MHFRSFKSTGSFDHANRLMLRDINSWGDVDAAHRQVITNVLLIGFFCQADAGHDLAKKCARADKILIGQRSRLASHSLELAGRAPVSAAAAATAQIMSGRRRSLRLCAAGVRSAEPPDDPMVFEAAGEVAEQLVALIDGERSTQPRQLLVQGADESLDASVAFGLQHDGRTGGDSDGLKLVLEGVRTSRRAMRFQDWASLPGVTPSARQSASSVSPRKSRRTTSALRQPGQRPRSSAPLALRRRRRLFSWLLHAVAYCAPRPKRVFQ